MIYINDDLANFDLAAALPLLSSQRLEQCLKFKHEQGRKENAAAYLLLREALRTEFGIDEAPVFDYNGRGKPVLRDFPDIHFNFSHCRRAVVCVVDSHPVGVDIEAFGRYRQSLAEHTMDAEELETIMTAQQPDMVFTQLWTMKEAVLKLRGTGIADSNLKTVLSGEETVCCVCNEQKGYAYSVAHGKNDVER